jgi:hypothetical protein
LPREATLLHPTNAQHQLFHIRDLSCQFPVLQHVSSRIAKMLARYLVALNISCPHGLVKLHRHTHVSRTAGWRRLANMLQWAKLRPELERAACLR